MLNNLEVAHIAAKLYVPALACDAIDMSKHIEADAHYALHDILAEMKPDAALLSIALTAKHIAGQYSGTNSGTEILSMECDRIIQEYGPLWLDYAKNNKEDDSYIFDIIENIPEDLENLAELIEANLAYASYDDPVVAEICDILTIQAGAHAIIAEEFLSVKEMNEAKEQKSPKVIQNNVLAANNASNVIAFPGRFAE